MSHYHNCLIIKVAPPFNMSDLRTDVVAVYGLALDHIYVWPAYVSMCRIKVDLESILSRSSLSGDELQVLDKAALFQTEEAARKYML